MNNRLLSVIKETLQDERIDEIAMDIQIPELVDDDVDLSFLEK